MLFKALAEEKIHKDIVLSVLLDMLNNTFSLQKYQSLSTEELHREIKQIIAENKGAPLPALMGICMKQLAGKASGKFISEELKKIVG